MLNLIKPVTEFFEFSFVDGDFFPCFYMRVLVSNNILVHIFFTISLQVILFHKICLIFQFSVEAFFIILMTTSCFHYTKTHTFPECFC